MLIRKVTAPLTARRRERRHRRSIAGRLAVRLATAVLLIAGFIGPGAGAAHAAQTWTVDTADDHSDPFLCAPRSDCTLREAIEEEGAGDIIDFDIPGSGVQTITLGSQHPEI